MHTTTFQNKKEEKKEKKRKERKTITVTATYKFFPLVLRVGGEMLQTDNQTSLDPFLNILNNKSK